MTYQPHQSEDYSLKTPSGETEAQRLEVVAAWNDLPDSLKAHPGLKRLYRALGGVNLEGTPSSEVPSFPRK